MEEVEGGPGLGASRGTWSRRCDSRRKQHLNLGLGGHLNLGLGNHLNLGLEGHSGLQVLLEGPRTL